MIDYSLQENQVKEFFSFLSQHTNMLIDLHLIHHDSLFDRSKSLKVVIAKDVKLTEAYRVLKLHNVFWKNDKKLENVYYSWSKNQGLNIAFVDDIQDIESFKSKDHLALIQTSKSKYQALFKLDKYVNPDELKEIQRVLKDEYGGDKGALGSYQLKRLVGFTNTKYSDGFIVRLTYKGSNVIETDKILQLVRENKIHSHIQYNNDVRVRQSTRESQNLKKWIDFYTGDESQADIRYALYLMGQGFSDPEIKERLLDESQDLSKRKGKRVNEYIDYTISKARDYYNSHNQPLKKPQKAKGLSLER